jgi:hypothetical protein
MNYYWDIDIDATCTPGLRTSTGQALRTAYANDVGKSIALINQVREAGPPGSHKLTITVYLPLFKALADILKRDR